MLRKLIIYIICLLPLAAHAQSEAEIIGIISKASAEMQSLECDFMQTKHLKILNNEMTSYGRMYYSHPDRLRWEYTSPYTYTFILNESQILLKNSNRSDVIDVNQNKMFKEIARVMMETVTGSSLADSRSFTTSIEDTQEEWIATLIPVKKDMKQMWTRLVLHFNKTTRNVEMVEMHEKTGDRTVIRLKNIRTDKPIDQDVFRVE